MIKEKNRGGMVINLLENCIGYMGFCDYIYFPTLIHRIMLFGNLINNTNDSGKRTNKKCCTAKI
jgi:hypothetical protein